MYSLYIPKKFALFFTLLIINKNSTGTVNYAK